MKKLVLERKVFSNVTANKAYEGGMMEDIKIENRRFEPEQNEALNDLSKQFARTFGRTAQTLDLDAELAQLLRLRVSQLNHRTFCMNLHAQTARDLGASRAKIDTLSAWWETDLFTAAERATLAYTEALTLQADTSVSNPFEDYHQALADHFAGR